MPVEFETVDGSGDVSLAVRVYKPDEGVQQQELVLVLVHQFTLLGGCQALLKGTAIELNRKGFNVVTLDMRGAGRSSGRASLTGWAEVQDVITVCEWTATVKFPGSAIVLVGSSAGAPIAGSAVDQTKHVVAYVGLGYPFGVLASVLFGRHYKVILQSPKPKLFVMGTKDGFTSVKQLETKLKSAAGRVELQLVPGVGHFEMEGPDYDPVMANMITEFCNSISPSPRRPSIIK